MPGQICGQVAPGFEAVREEFERNFLYRGELGAAFAATIDGEPIVDLWGGMADRARETPWRQDTLQLIFSGTKGLVAICLLLLIDRGVLDPAAPAAHIGQNSASRERQQPRLPTSRLTALVYPDSNHQSLSTTFSIPPGWRPGSHISHPLGIRGPRLSTIRSPTAGSAESS